MHLIEIENDGLLLFTSELDSAVTPFSNMLCPNRRSIVHPHMLVCEATIICLYDGVAIKSSERKENRRGRSIKSQFIIYCYSLINSVNEMEISM